MEETVESPLLNDVPVTIVRRAPAPVVLQSNLLVAAARLRQTEAPPPPPSGVPVSSFGAFPATPVATFNAHLGMDQTYG